MRQVLVELVGEEKIDIDDLKEVLNLKDWMIITDEEKDYLTSTKLNKISDYHEIIAGANEFLYILNGLANIFNFNHKNVDTGNIKIIEDGKYNLVLMTGTGEWRTRTRGTLAGLTGKSLLERTEDDKNIRDVAYFFKEINWWNLYKIFEIIRHDVGGEKNFRNLKLIEKDKYKLFTETANSRSAIGDKARHATPNNKKPKTDLTLKEAYKIILQLFWNWIHYKERVST